MGRIATREYNLSVTHPEVAAQWSNKNLFGPETVLPGSVKKVWWKCEKGHEWDAVIYNRTGNNSGCPYCSGHRLLPGSNDVASSRPDLLSSWSEKNTQAPNEVFKNSRTKVLWVCEKGHEWISSVNYRSDGHGCPYCASKRVLPGYNDLLSCFPDIAKQWSSRNEDSPGKVIAQSNKKYWWVCEEGHEWEVSPNNRVSYNSGCPLCVSHISKPEDELFSFIYSLWEDPPEIFRSKRNIIPPKELDLYIPSLNIAIEFNGIYWHSEKYKEKDEHFNKTQMCNEKGITLIHIWEDDWIYRKEIVKQLIRHKLGKVTGETVYARKTKVVPLSRKEISVFLNKHHILGATTGTYYLGLKYQDRIVAVTVLTRRKNTLTLDRYATSCSVPGGHSKLVSWVEKNLEYKTLVTFADLCLSNGDLYEKTGWKKDSILAPDYKYLVGTTRVHKFNYRLKRFRNDPDLLWAEGMTERQLAELNGLVRVWDCGKIRYIKEKP